MKKRRTSRSKHLDFILVDMLSVELSLLIACNLYRNSELFFQQSYTLVNVLILLLHICLVFVQNGYSGILRRGYYMELKKVLIHNIQLAGGVFVILFLVKQSTAYSRVILVLFFVFNTAIMYILRIIHKKSLMNRKLKERHAIHLLIVAQSDKVSKIAEHMSKYKYAGHKIVGVAVMDQDMVGESIEEVPVVATSDNVKDFVKENIIDEVFVYSGDEDWTKLIQDLLTMGVAVHISIDTLTDAVPNATVQNMGGCTVVTTSVNVMTLKQRLIKRLMDICGGIVGVIATGILFIIFAPIIYIQSPGPIFFKQKRVGKNGRTFTMYKFRSMYMDAEARKAELMSQNKMDGLMFKMDNDPRVTPIGKFIRKTSIDEFPQFWNVLKGDMSLVGTRPPTVDEYEKYKLHHKSRLAMKPGLTGMWQVSGRSDITDFEEVVRLDNEYIMNFYLGLDLKIIFKTIGVLFKRKGAV